MRHPPYSSEVLKQLEILDCELLGNGRQGEHRGSISMCKSIRRYLSQFRIRDRYQDSDVLRETYITARRKIIEGEKVKNFTPWLQRIAFNIVRNYKKDETRQEKKISKLIADAQYLNDIFDSSEIEGDDDSGISSLDKHKIRTAWENLSERDRKILFLRVVQDLRWNDIGAQEAISSDAAKKRGSRALKRFRHEYFSISQSGESSVGGES